MNVTSKEIKPRTVYLLRRTNKEDDGIDLYIGSTSTKLEVRLSKHKHFAKICNTKLHKRISETGSKNWAIEPLRLHTCDKNKILEVEAKMIRRLQPDLNVRSPINTKNKRGNKKLMRDRYYHHKRNKTYYCDVCDKAFGKKFNLEKHLRSLKHSYTYLNSPD